MEVKGRDLMAQLSWVTDCAFAYAKSGEDEPTYLLLSTSIGAGAMERVRDERDAAIAALEARTDPHMQVAAQVRSEMLTRLPELANALTLTRDEAIRRYKGKDDLMLLAALDPTRRLIGEFVLSLSDEQLEDAGMHISAIPRLSELPAEHSVEVVTADEALRFLHDQDAETPFLLHLSFNRPHPPYAPPPEYLNHYDPERIALPEPDVDWAAEPVTPRTSSSSSSRAHRASSRRSSLTGPPRASRRSSSSSGGIRSGA